MAYKLPQVHRHHGCPNFRADRTSGAWTAQGMRVRIEKRYGDKLSEGLLQSCNAAWRLFWGIKLDATGVDWQLLRSDGWWASSYASRCNQFIKQLESADMSSDWWLQTVIKCLTVFVFWFTAIFCGNMYLPTSIMGVQPGAFEMARSCPIMQ